MSNDDMILRLLIQLRSVEPQVWRRIEVPASYTMWDLHVAIQDAMGWLDSHLHAFRIDGEEGVQYGIPDEDGTYEGELGIRMEAGWLHQATTLFAAPGDSAVYEYDFGDSWLHDVIFEGFAAAEAGVYYPRCTGGAEPCPPEDCGGPGGYAELLDAFINPHDKHARDLLEWASGDVTRYPPWQPGRFDITELVFDESWYRWQEAFMDGEDADTLLPSTEDPWLDSLPDIQTEEEATIDRLVNTISLYTGRYEREAVDEIILRRDVMVPHLVEILIDTLQFPEEIAADTGYLAHLHSVLLVGHLRATQAHAVLVALASLPADLPSRLFDDLLLEELPAVLLQTCDGDLTFIRYMALNVAVDVWGRTSAIDAIVFAVVRGICSREEALAFLAEMLDRCSRYDDILLPSHIVYRMAILHPEGFVDHVDRAYAKGIIDESYIDRERFEAIMEQGREVCLDALRSEWEERFPEDIHERLEGWVLPPKDQFLETEPPTEVAKKKKHRRKQTTASRKKNRKK